MIIIGEKINATLPAIKKMILDRDDRQLAALASAQAEAGANFIDINVGTGVGGPSDEIASMKWAVDVIQAAVDKPLCIDSADADVMAAGLEQRTAEQCMLNSVKAKPEDLDHVVPLAAAHQADLVALAMTAQGIPQSVDGRLAASEMILNACGRHGLSHEKVYLDPLVMPLSTDVRSARVTLDTLCAMAERFPQAKTVTGLSNVSFGLPARGKINAGFLHMCLYAGLDAAFLDPLNAEVMAAVQSGEALMGRDRHCRRYARAFR